MTDSLSAIRHLISDMAGKPASQIDDICHSANGDHWQLVRDAPGSRILVRRTCHVSSGGAVTEMTVEQFLTINGSGPELGAFHSLLEKIATV